MSPPTLAVSVGCPAGIGPEIAVSAAARESTLRCVLVGDPEVARRAARLRRIGARRLVPVDSADAIEAMAPGRVGLWTPSQPLLEPVVVGRPSPAAGAASLAWIDQACELVTSRCCDGLVTAPVSKAEIASSGAPGARRFAGHTEHLARLLGAAEVVMAFHAPVLTTALVTTHVPIRKLARAITPARVASACVALVGLLRRLGTERPRVAVASLNPHAGEDGMFGSEEQGAIVPGMTTARRRLAGQRLAARLHGPMGAESAYRLAVDGAFDGVVAMYHDQATIPCKLVSFGDSVNVTLGLPIVRTSVDHGTAYDLAGSGQASDESMGAALRLAARLA